MSAFPCSHFELGSAAFLTVGHSIWSLTQADTMESAQGSIFRVFIYRVWSVPI